jgi:DNA-binding NarL/FixJ family response regulator
MTTPDPGTDRPGRGAVRVVLVDDHDRLRSLYERFLNDADGIEVVASCGTARSGIDAAGRLRPDVLLLDLSLPDIPGLDAIGLVRAIAPGTEVIVVSGSDASIASRDVEAAGAAAFVDKIDATRVLVPTIHRVVSGRTQT